MQMHLTVKDATGNDVTRSEVLVTESSPDEAGRSVYISSAEKMDSDSVGQEIAPSMMTVLLPRALPLLKTFSRRKKKIAKPLKTLTHGFQEKNKGPDITMTNATTGKVLSVLPEYLTVNLFCMRHFCCHIIDGLFFYKVKSNHFFITLFYKLFSQRVS